MSLLLVSFCVLFFSNAVQGQIKALAKGEIVNLRFLKSKVHFGQLPTKYQPLTDDDVAVSSNLTKLVESLRYLFSTGGQGLPPLDPYRLKTLSSIPVNTGLVSGQVTLNNLVLNGLKSFHLDKIEARMINNRVDFKLTVPLITIEVDYEVDLIISSFLPYSVAGHASIQVSNLELSGAFRTEEFPFRGLRVYQLTALDVDVSSDNVKLRVTGLDSDEVIDLLDSTGLADENLLVSFLDHQVLDRAGKIVSQYINDFLKNFPKEVILKNLLGKSQEKTQ